MIIFRATIQSGRVRSYRKSDDVWQPDDRSDSIFFLQSGQIAILNSDRDGREVVFGVIESGEPFGELCFCQPKKHFLRETYARAVVKSEVLEIKLDDFMSYLQKDSNALWAFTFTFCCRLSDCQTRVEFLAYRGAEEASRSRFAASGGDARQAGKCETRSNRAADQPR